MRLKHISAHFLSVLTGLSDTPELDVPRFSFVLMQLDCTEVGAEELFRLPFPEGLVALPAEALVEDELVESLRIGFVRSMLEGGDFKRSVTGKSSTLFSLMLPVLVELPSNTIKGRFLPLSALELHKNIKKAMCLKETLERFM